MRAVALLLTTLAAKAVLVGTAELLAPERGRRRLDRRQALTDLGWMALYVAYVPWVGALTWAAVRDVGHGRWAGAVAAWPWAIRVASAALTAELVHYGIHRAMHTVPFLWRLHSVHHSSTDVRWWSTFRFHPVDSALTLVVPAVVAAWCGFGAAAIAPYMLVVGVVTLFAHADVFVPGRVLAAVVVTPAFHRSHHEVGRDQCNFALVLPAFDVLFGSASFEVDDRNFGTDATVPSHGVLDQLAWGSGLRPSRRASVSALPRRWRVTTGWPVPLRSGPQVGEFEPTPALLRPSSPPPPRR